MWLRYYYKGQNPIHFLILGGKAVNEQLLDVPILTIHDSILIEKQYSELVTPNLKDSLNSLP